MLRRHAITTTIAALTALGVAAFDAVASGPGTFRGRRRTAGQASPRVYRSYSVSPEAAAIPESAPGLESPPVSVQPAPARAARPSKSKPSYMRADSKAMGRFGQ